MGDTVSSGTLSSVRLYFYVADSYPWTRHFTPTKLVELRLEYFEWMETSSVCELARHCALLNFRKSASAHPNSSVP